MPANSQLSMRHFTLDDSSFVLELLNTEGWLKFIGNKKVNNLEDAARYIAKGPLVHYKEAGLGLQVITVYSENKKIEVPVGVCGLLKRDYLPFPDIGYALLPEYQGRGFVSWAVKQVINNTQSNKEIPELYAITDTRNVRSKNVLKRNYFEYLEMREINGHQVDIYHRNL